VIGFQNTLGWTWRFTWIVCWLPCLANQGALFESDIRPLLREHCYRCHGAKQQKASLRLDLGHTDKVWAGESGPAWIRGNAQDSLMVQLLEDRHADIAAMPYNKDVLPGELIDKIRQWIDAGAVIPETTGTDALQHWAYVPPRRAKVPAVNLSDWPRNPIDFFILSALETEGLSPSAQANTPTLMRRLALDVTGLPPLDLPTDTISDASYLAAVDRLLASPRFGERWGRHWLDVARYADSNGYSVDSKRTMWRYRDWVIDAMNRDMPFDQFTLEQIAGDLLPEASLDQIIATGFHRNTQINQEGGIDREQFRMESIFDRMATTGAAFLGLTLSCAQCHDHKFDTISQEEYYRLFAFFNNQDEPTISAPTQRESRALTQWKEQYDPVRQQLRTLEKELPDKVWNWEKFFDRKDTEQAPEEIRSILTKLPSERTKEDTKKLIQHFKQHDRAYLQVKAHVDALNKKKPRVTTAMVLKERTEPRKTHLLIKGDFTRPDREVQPGVPASLHPMPNVESPDRTDLARWITSSSNPLTARVIMNRVWLQYFGAGIVETENDFGTQGTRPQNPELLDWLAIEWMESGWSLKHIHRLILTSATYRQSSRNRQELTEKDPTNQLLGRQNRIRMESEIVRDVTLQAAGLLESHIGGPSVHPPQPEGVMGLGQVQRSWKADAGRNRYRRGMYTFLWRATPHPALSVFDSPDAFSSCTRRIRSNTPLQALTLLNDPAFHEMALHLSHIIQTQGGADDRNRLLLGFTRCTARKPTEGELRALLDFVQIQRTQLKDSQLKHTENDIWMDVARILLNLDETITRE
jgi:hypothetical protein